MERGTGARESGEGWEAGREGVVERVGWICRKTVGGREMSETDFDEREGVGVQLGIRHREAGSHSR